LLRTETVWRFRNGDFHEQTPLKWRSVTTSTQEILDMKGGKDGDETIKFKILSDELKLQIRENRDHSENMFVFSSRRGLSPTVVCGDCGEIVRCNKCSVPIVLHGASDDSSKNFFLCHKCGEKRTAEEKCKKCGSWKLTTLGIGIETIEKEIKKEFPGIKIFKIDYDTVKKHKKAEEIAEEFYSSPGSIVLGTEMALLYLDKKIENTAVAGMDSMFSVPDFRINEKIMNILLKIRSLTNKKLLIQTRQPEQKVFEYATRGNLIDFYRNEIAEREKFGYPPFCILVKITFQGNKDAVSKEMANLKNLLAPYVVQIFPAFIETVNRKFVMHGLIKVPKENWIDKNLLEKLSNLPQYYSIRIDPENLL
ncbi:hypothetical protein IT397_00630, partial [Candidatus Nomurabacteria bacterium]|nr:hypothetical protein [Candidatus Nomurabacteria bacterium]